MSGHSVGLFFMGLVLLFWGTAKYVFWGWKPTNHTLLLIVGGFLLFAFWGYWREAVDEKEQLESKIKALEAERQDSN